MDNNNQNLPTSNQDSVSTSPANTERENLKAVLQVGLTIQMISVAIAFAMKKGKEDFLKKLNDLLLELNNGLSDEEKKELGEDTNRMIDQKAQELVTSLGEQLSEEELKAAIEEMKNIAQG